MKTLCIFDCFGPYFRAILQEYPRPSRNKLNHLAFGVTAKGKKRNFFFNFACSNGSVPLLHAAETLDLSQSHQFNSDWNGPARRVMEVTDFAFFPTRVLTFQFPNTEPLNSDLCHLLEHRPELDDRFNMHPDAMNLLRLAATVPAIEQLRSMFITGAKRWLDAEGILGVEGLDCLLFSNRLGRGEFTIVHNHPADLVGIYYARTVETSRPPIDPAAGDDYFDAGDGLLVLHDPRLNANLTSVCNRDHVKVFPRPGLMLIFPAYVWHSVTPHRGDFHRIAYSMNFTLRWPTGPAEFCPLK